MEEPKKKLDKKSIRNLLGIYRFTLPYKRDLILSLFFLFTSTSSFLLFPNLMKNLIDSTKIGFNEVNRYAAIMFGILIFMSVTSYFRTIINTRLSEKTTRDIRLFLYNKIISLPLTYFEKNRVGDISSRMSNDITQVNEMLTWSLSEMLRQVIILIVGTGMILYTNATLGLVMISTFPVTILVAIYLGKKIKKLSKKTQEEIGKSSTIVEETLQAIQSVKTYANEFFEGNRFKSTVDQSLEMAIDTAKYRGGLIAFVIIGIFGGIILVFWYGMRMVAAVPQELTFGEFFSFIFMTGIIGGSVGTLGDIYTRMTKTAGSSERLLEVLNEDSEIEIAEAKPLALQGKIEFREVFFQYPTRPDIEVLKGISFSVQPGEKVAIVGQSGSGKSTIAKLIFNLYDWESGTIKMDGKSIQEYNKTDYRNAMAIVPQEVLLFGGTIRENLLYAKANATVDELRMAAEQANAWGFIQSFPEGLDTIVGERGVQLSGGQKQRIAIARALLKNPKVLVLDEATSSLDNESERLIQDSLNELMKGRTSIIIAHRLSTIQNADRIIVLQNGLIVEEGKHEALIAKEQGVYASLLKIAELVQE